MVFFISGWRKRRSTRTTTVLSCLSLTTTPCNVRFGIRYSLLLSLDAALDLAAGFALAFGAAFGLSAALVFGSALAFGSGAPARFCAAMVLSRAMSRRTWRVREVFSSWPVAR